METHARCRPPPPPPLAAQSLASWGQETLESELPLQPLRPPVILRVCHTLFPVKRIFPWSITGTRAEVPTSPAGVEL